MAVQIYTNIKGLVQVRNMPQLPLRGAEMSSVPIIENAFLVREDGIVIDFGSMNHFSSNKWSAHSIIDLSGKYVLPAFCDSHTHTVFACSREGEFVDKINGLSYEEIAAKGGGILNSANTLRTTDEETLFLRAKERIEKMISNGTGAIEIKSGYGLNFENEIKMLKVIKRLSECFSIPIKSTFLAAHAIPLEYKNNKDQFVSEIIEKWIPFVGKENLAEYIDVFCERNYFSVEDLHIILKEAGKYGMTPKVHVNQFSSLGGIEVAVKLNAKTVDHLEELSDEDIEALKNSKTIATLLPACSFYLGIPYGNARKILNNGLPLCLASDFNPGSAPNYNLFFVWSLACIKMKLSPEEAFNALTINGAFAMGLESSHGCICKGYSGNLIVTKQIESFAYLPYAFGESNVDFIISK